MSYKADVVPVFSSRDWYQRLVSSYADYHQRLDSFDHQERKRFLPRSLVGFSIVDLWAGDGRTYRIFEHCSYARYVACDFTAWLLRQHPGSDVEKVLMDLSQPFVLKDSDFDLALSFFVLEHLEDLLSFFSEVYRVLAEHGLYIFTYFPQRRQYVHRWGFKIETFPHTYAAIESAATDAFFSFRFLSFLDNNREVGRAYCFTK